MSVEKLREEFERVIPAPTYVYWNVEHQRYMSSGNPLGCIEHQGKWIGWQASRESLVIELPPVRPEPASSGDPLHSDGEAATWNIWVGDKLAKKECREAIEALGLKVTP